MKIVCNAAYPAIEALAAEIASAGVPAGAELIYDGGRNRVYRYVHQGVEVCIKAFKVPNFVNAVAYATVRKSKARRTYEYAERLNQMGLLSPEPLAYIEERKGPTIGRSYYVCLYVDGQTVRDWERKADAEALLAALGSEIAAMHRLGVWHKDFSPGNVIYTGDAAEGYKFYHVDVNRMAFGVRSRSKLMRNFRSIHLNEDEVARLARHYAAAAGLDAAAVELEARRQSRKYKHGKERHNILKRLLKP